MNGRIYDPVIGQFMQPDNYVQFPELAAGYNRFSYCMNNPLNYTDPSGEVIEFMIMAASAVLLAENVHTTDMLYGSRAATSAAVQGLFEIGLNYALGELSSALFSEVGLTFSDIGGSGIDFKLTPRLVYSSYDGLGIGIEASFGYNLFDTHQFGIAGSLTFYGSGYSDYRYGAKYEWLTSGNIDDTWHLGLAMSRYGDSRGERNQGTWMIDVGKYFKDEDGLTSDFSFALEEDADLIGGNDAQPEDYYRTAAACIHYGNAKTSMKVEMEVYTSEYVRWSSTGNPHTEKRKGYHAGEYRHAKPSMARGMLTFGVSEKWRGISMHVF